MTGFEIIERLIRDSRQVNITFAGEHIDDLPGHTREKGGELVPFPTNDTFLGDIRRRVNTEVDRLTKSLGKQIGF